jgi:CBS domain-containing protein
MMLIVHILKDKGNAVYSIADNATLQDAAELLDDKRVGAVVVLDERGGVEGVLSERDIVRQIARCGPDCLRFSVGSVMSRGVITADPSETIDDGLARMTERRVRHLPVVAKDGRLIGVVSIGDLVKRKIDEALAEADGLKAYIATG